MCNEQRFVEASAVNIRNTSNRCRDVHRMAELPTGRWPSAAPEGELLHYACILCILARVYYPAMQAKIGKPNSQSQ